MNYKRVLSLFILLVVSVPITAQTNCVNKPWLDTSLTFDERIELLLNCLTVEEKISQLLNSSSAVDRLNIKSYNWWNEALHGVARGPKATIFPQAIGMAATFDTKLIHNVGDIISEEARAINNYLLKQNKESLQYLGLTFWSPNVNIFRDPRWGRGQETYGEDPFLSGQIGAAFINGMQGNDSKYLKTAACAKHYAVHSGPEALRHSFNAVVNQQDLHETYLPAFKACVDAGVEAVMCAYNRTNGEACCGSPTLLQDILRKDWGFDGHIVSDCRAIRNFHKFHGVTKSPEESAALALLSGTNLNCGKTYNELGNALKKGLITEVDIDQGLRPLLKTKFKLGMFDKPEDNPYSSIGLEVIRSKEHIKLSREVAQKSIVLLKNNDVLPLKKDLEQIYISGPLAVDVRTLLGNYHGMGENLVTLLEGITAKVSPLTKVQYRSGAMINQANINDQDSYTGLARSSDATIIGLGLTIVMEGEEHEAIGSPSKGDNITMQLPESQLQLLRDMRNKQKHDKPIIAVIFAGCPLDLSEVSELADAIIYAWYPGEQGGNAIADILFGDVSPSGKLPITFPKNKEQLPAYEDYNMAGRTYKYMTKEPLYPFGYGLGYSTLSITNLTMNSKDIEKGKSYQISSSITNTGDSKLDDVIQLYISLKDNNENVPLSSLKDFKRISLKPGESKSLDFVLGEDAFNFINTKGESKRHNGKAEIIIGNSSPGNRSMDLGATLKTIEVEIK
tara:strand:+ start:9016 stop:11214 length:2199 start_codon:yes stop_codon:yes gene_type:complete